MTVDWVALTSLRNHYGARALHGSMATIVICVTSIGCAKTLDTTVDGICEDLAECAFGAKRGSFERECRSNLKDALEDRRMRQEQALACSDCLDNNKLECDELLERRDCDLACDGVTTVLRTRTSREEKQALCTELHDACVLPDVETCRTGLASALVTSIEGDGMLDTRLEACVDCVVGAQPVVAADLQCRSLLDSCHQKCETVVPLRAQLALAGVALELCATKIERCTTTTTPSDTDAGSPSAESSLAAWSKLFWDQCPHRAMKAAIGIGFAQRGSPNR